jgi:hypothetical protein
MNTTLRNLKTLVLLPLVVLAGHAAHLRLPVKVGQQTVDAKRLPFVCLTIGTDGARVPIEKLVIEEIGTHAEFTAQLGKTFGNDHPDYPFGADEKRRALSMAIFELQPGSYRIKSIEFTPEGIGTERLIVIPPSEVTFWFHVKPATVNFVGTLMIAANWSEVQFSEPPGPPGLGATISIDPSKRIAVRFTVEHTERRDAKWAATLIPCLRSLPYAESPLGQP